MLSDEIKRISSLADNARRVSRPCFLNGATTRAVVAGAATPARPSPLVVSEETFVDAWLAEFHRNGEAPTAFDIGCYFARDVIVTGIGHIFINDMLVTSRDIIPPYWEHAISHHGIPDLDEERRRPERFLAGATIIFCGWGLDVYGHLLTEMLPKLLIARRALRGEFDNTQLLVPMNPPQWFCNVLQQVIKDCDRHVRWYDPIKENVRLECAIIPTLASLNEWYHPFLNEIVSDIVSEVGLRLDRTDALATRIFVTRALFSNPATETRRCLNELELAEIAAKEFGFAIVAPETFPWPTQVALFSNASVIAGEFGSGLHNAVFASPRTRVGVIGVYNITQTMIGAARCHSLAYLRTIKDEHGNYKIDTDLFRRFLSALLERSQ